MSHSRRRSSAGLTLGATVAGLLAALLALPAPAVAARTSAPATLPDCHPAVPFDRSDFPRHPRIDNRFLPLVPGTRTVLSGTVLGDDGKLHPHRIVSIASGVTKVIDGVRTLALFERDYEDGKLQESELAFQAQDERGTLWNVGEYPEEYENGKLVGADSTWIAGIAHARAGVNMLAHPRTGAPGYLQGSAPSVEFRDCAKVYRTGQRVCVPVRCFDGVLVTDEWAPLDPEGGHQLKYYAPGVGNIRVGAIGGANQEVLKLTGLDRLCRGELARVNAAVLVQDRRGYRVSPDVYGHTARAH